MSHFTDCNQRKWFLEITINEVRHVKKVAGLDLLDLDEGRVLNQLANDPVLLVDVLWLLCEEQARKHGIDDQQFGRAFRGDVIEQAAEALFEALVDFFPPQRQLLLKRVMEVSRSVGQKERLLLEQFLDSPILEQKLESELKQMQEKLEHALTAGSSSTNSPASAESTPEASASET